MSSYSSSRRAFLAASAGLFASSLSPRLVFAQSQSWDAVIANAKKEGLVNFYSVAAPDQNDSLIQAFNERYPEIRVVTTRGTAELTARIGAEIQTGSDGCDVLCQADPVWFTDNAAQLLELNTPAAKDFPKEGWQVANKAAVTTYSPLGFLVWNTDFVKQDLSNWNDILRPEFKGRVGVREGMTATLAGFLDFIQTELGIDYLEKLGQQKPRFYSSSVPLTQAVASGEVWVANTGNIPTIRQLKAEGAPIAYSFPNPSFANPQITAALSRSRRPNAALLFTDFSISPKGQTSINDQQRSASAIRGLEGTLDITKFRNLDTAKYNAQSREKWNKVFERYLRQR